MNRRQLEFAVGDHVFLKISLNGGMIIFDSRVKLSLRFIGRFDILKSVGEVAYRMALPPSLEGVHGVFYVSQLSRYVRDNSHVLDHSK